MTRSHDPVCPHRAHPRFERKPILSSSYRNRLARTMPEYEEPEPAPDYQLAGPLSPPANGAYYETGTYNGQPYYRRRNGQPWFLWYDDRLAPDTYMWYITQTLGDETGTGWRRITAGAALELGDYAPINTAAGTAVLTAY